MSIENKLPVSAQGPGLAAPPCSAFFLVIGHGEGYFTKICREDQLPETVAGMIYDEAKDMPDEERAQWEQDLSDDDQWSHSPDIGKTRFCAGLGETDHIDIWRILDLPNRELSDAQRSD